MTSSKHSPPSVAVGHDHDMEAGGVGGWTTPHETEFVDPFDIGNTKNASIETLKRWRQAALVLNASRRFRYTLDLRKEEEKEQRRRMIRAHAQVIRAALLFKLAGQRAIVLGSAVTPPTPSGDYSGDYEIGLEQVASMTRDNNNAALQQYGGVKGLADLLQTNVETGIVGGDDEFAKRRNAFGSNTYPVKKGRTFWRFLWEAWQDLTLIILMVAAIASLALGIKTEGLQEGWYDGGSIAFAVLLVIFVTATSDYRQSLQFQNLNEEKRNIHLEVIRGGRREKISIYDIVVGDVIPLKIGDQVPADGILISGHSLSIDESSMTGESKIVRKDQKAPFFMSGCKVADGSGTMLVTGVGINTEWGLLMASISEDTGEETPLQVRLNGVATFIGIVGLSVALFVLAILLARYFTGHSRNADGTVQFVRGKTSIGDAVDGAITIVTIAVTIVVVAVPEGLPLAVTLTLAYSMRKMMADKALVRRLSACETMGSATTICSDKTGTLTLNQMTVVDAYVGRNKINPPEDSSQFDMVVSSLIHNSIAQNTSGSVFPSKDGGDIEVSGSPTEKAILHWGVKLGMKFDVIRSESEVLQVSPFNSEKKRGGVALKKANSQVHIHWKGAAEIVLASCTGYLDSNGSQQSIDNDKREPLITNVMWRNLIIQALYQVSILLVLNFFGKSILNLNDSMEHANQLKNSLIFNAFVLCQIFNEFNARKPDQVNVFSGILKNRLFVGIVGTTFLLQIIIIEFLGHFFSTVRLDWKLWIVSLVIGIISWPLAVVGKLIPVPRTPLIKIFIKPYQRCIAARSARNA
ncbi:Calcium-transporting ATPase [Actinidia chinensis var. chinensis]|uniref:Calcium-transporting ATPase n=1 Tax=Actinidia chinensis var. chinensis TaxID=1590841 RepID=A0A2R6R0L7_ACTCC|nr:Calcium-transporting ATPase [Actinidia chinensis var. chinensis]